MSVMMFTQGSSKKKKKKSFLWFRNMLQLSQPLNYRCCEIALEKLTFSISCRQAGHFINIQKTGVVSGEPSILYNNQGSSLLNQIKHRGASLSRRSDTENPKKIVAEMFQKTQHWPCYCNEGAKQVSVQQHESLMFFFFYIFGGSVVFYGVEERINLG